MNRIFKWSILLNSNTTFDGSGYGTVGRTVASDTRGPRFESDYQQVKEQFFKCAIPGLFILIFVFSADS